MAAKLRNMVSLAFLVYAKDIPGKVNLREHSLQFLGSEKMSSDGLITGVYGAHSKQMALVCSANWSRERAASSGRNRILMLDANYRVDNYDLTRTQVRPDTLQKTGWLHLDRVATSFREEIKAQWLAWVHADSAPGVAARLADMSLADIAQQYPHYVLKMLQERPDIRGIVHPVNPVIDPSVALWAATVRYEADRFENASVRFLPHIQVAL
jgi:hypothetical protein